MPSERLKAAFEAKFTPEPNTGCWLWMGASNNKGYGNFRSRSAHVVSYELYKGDVPAGMQVDHICNVKCCVNPDHLRILTPRENTRRNLRNVCANGHRLEGANVKIVHRADGVRRKCLPCQTIYKRRKRARARHGK